MNLRSKLYLALAATTFSATAFGAGNYVPGVEGVQAASVPPPGIYYLAYLVNYNIDQISNVPGDNTGTVSVIANRLVWISNHKLFGANFGMGAIAPVQANSLTFNGIGYAGTSRGLGNLYLEPVILAWHGTNWDGVFALGRFLNSANYSSTNPSSVGTGYGSTMLTLGGTYYPDSKKEWSASVLARFEKNSTQSQTGITPGDGLTVEWGIGRQIGGGKDVGLVGYYQDQTSSNSGPGANPLNPSKSGIGIQFDYPILDHGVILKFAGYTEYSARGGAAEGNLLRMTIVKAF